MTLRRFGTVTAITAYTDELKSSGEDRWRAQPRGALSIPSADSYCRLVSYWAANVGLELSPECCTG
jgi:hypothetical protein